MPNRDLYESNRRSPSLQLLSDASERLWYRLITAVDDFGRLEADPEVVFTTCFQRVPRGWTIAKTERCLLELSQFAPDGDEPLIRLYQVDGRPYLQIRSAETRIRCRATKSKYPDPPVSEQIQESPKPLIADKCQHPPSSASDLRTPNSDLRTNDLRTSDARRHAPAHRGSTYPEEFLPDTRAETLAAGYSLNVHKLHAAFADHHRANGSIFKDWQAAFRNWIRNEVKFSQRRANAL